MLTLPALLYYTASTAEQHIHAGCLNGYLPVNETTCYRDLLERPQLTCEPGFKRLRNGSCLVYGEEACDTKQCPARYTLKGEVCERITYFTAQPVCPHDYRLNLPYGCSAVKSFPARCVDPAFKLLPNASLCVHQVPKVKGLCPLDAVIWGEDCATLVPAPYKLVCERDTQALVHGKCVETINLHPKCPAGSTALDAQPLQEYPQLENGEIVIYRDILCQQEVPKVPTCNPDEILVEIPIPPDPLTTDPNTRRTICRKIIEMKPNITCPDGATKINDFQCAIVTKTKPFGECPTESTTIDYNQTVSERSEQNPCLITYKRFPTWVCPKGYTFNRELNLCIPPPQDKISGDNTTSTTTPSPSLSDALLALQDGPKNFSNARNSLTDVVAHVDQGDRVDGADYVDIADQTPPVVAAASVIESDPTTQLNEVINNSDDFVLTNNIGNDIESPESNVETVFDDIVVSKIYKDHEVAISKRLLQQENLPQVIGSSVPPVPPVFKCPPGSSADNTMDMICWETRFTSGKLFCPTGTGGTLMNGTCISQKDAPAEPHCANGTTLSPTRDGCTKTMERPADFKCPGPASGPTEDGHGNKDVLTPSNQNETLCDKLVIRRLPSAVEKVSDPITNCTGFWHGDHQCVTLHWEERPSACPYGTYPFILDNNTGLPLENARQKEPKWFNNSRGHINKEFTAIQDVGTDLPAVIAAAVATSVPPDNMWGCFEIELPYLEPSRMITIPVTWQCPPNTTQHSPSQPVCENIDRVSPQIVCNRLREELPATPLCKDGWELVGDVCRKRQYIERSDECPPATVRIYLADGSRRCISSRKF